MSVNQLLTFAPLCHLTKKDKKVHFPKDIHFKMESSCNTSFGLRPEKYKLEYIIPASMLLIPCSIIGVFLNSLIIIAIWKTPSIQTPSMLLICSLGLTDFLVAAITQPLYVTFCILLYLRKCDVVRIIFNINTILGYSLINASGCTLVAISIDRYLAISTRLRYKVLVTKRRVIGIIVYIWTVPFPVMLVMAYYRYDIPHRSSSLFGTLLIVLCIIAFFYSRSFFLLNKMLGRSKKEVKPFTKNVSHIQQRKSSNQQSVFPAQKKNSCAGIETISLRHRESSSDLQRTASQGTSHQQSAFSVQQHFFPFKRTSLTQKENSSTHQEASYTHERSSSTREGTSATQEELYSIGTSVPHQGTSFPQQGASFTVSEPSSTHSTRNTFLISKDMTRKLTNFNSPMHSPTCKETSSPQKGTPVIPKGLYSDHQDASSFQREASSSQQLMLSSTNQKISPGIEAAHQAPISSHQCTSSNFEVFKYKKTFLTMMIVLVLCVISYLPMTIYFSVTDDDSLYSRPYIVHSLEIIVLLNSTFNPVLYLWRMRDLRQAVRNILPC